MTAACDHLSEVTDATPGADGCEDCLAAGGRWVHLRMCRMCGHIGCCDSSPGKHATAHFHSSGHPLVQSFEPGENWWWCYTHEVVFQVKGAPSYSHGAA